MSPDGQRMAFVRHRIHGNLDVFVVPTDSSALPVALTQTLETTDLVKLDS